MSKKYHLRFRQSSCSYISTWKISNFLDDLASNYYKEYVLNEVTASYANVKDNLGFELVVFDKSFDLYQQYGKLDDLSFEKTENYKNIYFLGNPISFKPNIIIWKISLIFELHRDLFTKLNGIDVLMNRDKIGEYIKDNYNKNETFNFRLINEHLNDLLDLNDKKHNEIYKQCTKLMSLTSEKLDDFVKKILDFKIINEIEDEQELERYLSKERNASLYKMYYESFKDTFNSLERPIVGIFDLDNCRLKILAKEFIQESLQKDNNQKLEMVGLKRNSPMILDFITGVIVVSWLGQLALSKWEERKLKLVKKNDKKIVEDEKESNNLEIERLNDLILNVKDDDLAQDSFNENVVNINDLRVQRSFKKMNQKIKNDTKETLNRHNFLNSRIEIVKNSEDDENSLD